jgi:hypothetical protein
MDDRGDELFQPPGVVREKLARNYEDADLLRRLLKLSVAAAEKARERKTKDLPRKAASHEAQ